MTVGCEDAGLPGVRLRVAPIPEGVAGSRVGGLVQRVGCSKLVSYPDLLQDTLGKQFRSQGRLLLG